MMNAVHKLAWSVCTAGLLETLRGLFRLGQGHITTKEGIVLRYNGFSQQPTLLVVAGQYVDPEYTFLAANVKEGWRVVDVGAGIGQFALYMGKLGAYVVAYEPSPQNVGTLIDNIHDNGLDGKIGWRPHALGAYADAGSLRLSMRGLNTSTTEEGGLEVLSTTLDEEFGDNVIDLLKVNTAGTEWEVLHGATNMLREGRARYLCVLIGDRMMTKVPELDSYGYQFFCVSQDGRIWPWPAHGPYYIPPFCRHVLAHRRKASWQQYP